MHLLVSELYIYQNARSNDKKKDFVLTLIYVNEIVVPENDFPYVLRP